MTTDRESLEARNRRMLRILLSVITALVATCFWIGTRW
jgi:hypothetical protein